MNPLALNDLIGPALDKAGDEAFLAVEWSVATLRQKLDRYEAAIRAEARHKVLVTMLSAIGQPAPARVEEDALEDVIADLLDVMRAFSRRLAPKEHSSSTPAPSTSTSSAPAPTLRSRTELPAEVAERSEERRGEAPRGEEERSEAKRSEERRGEAPRSEERRGEAPRSEEKQAERSLVEDPPSKETLKLCYDLFKEIDALRAKGPSMHELRILPWMQAIMADIRLALRRLPPKHVMFGKLESCISILRALKGEPWGAKGFVKGLAYEDQFDTHADWVKISQACRAKMARFDKDAEIASQIAQRQAEKAARREERREEKPKTEEAETLPSAAPSAEPEPPPAWPNLRKAMGLNPIFIVGNVKNAMRRAEQVGRRFDLPADCVEWCVIDNDKGSNRQLDNVASRILSGNVSGVVILEGFVNHKVTKKIEAACFAQLVPYAYGNKGGIGEVQAGLAELDRKLGCIDKFGVPSVDANLAVLDAQMGGPLIRGAR